MAGTPLDWLIVGGGVHGTILSHALVHRGGVSPACLRVLDPHQAPLAAVAGPLHDVACLGRAARAEPDLRHDGALLADGRVRPRHSAGDPEVDPAAV